MYFLLSTIMCRRMVVSELRTKKNFNFFSFPSLVGLPGSFASLSQRRYLWDPMTGNFYFLMDCVEDLLWLDATRISQSSKELRCLFLQ